MDSFADDVGFASTEDLSDDFSDDLSDDFSDDLSDALSDDSEPPLDLPDAGVARESLR